MASGSMRVPRAPSAVELGSAMELDLGWDFGDHSVPVSVGASGPTLVEASLAVG